MNYKVVVSGFQPDSIGSIPMLGSNLCLYGYPLDVSKQSAGSGVHPPHPLGVLSPVKPLTRHTFLGDYSTTAERAVSNAVKGGFDTRIPYQISVHW